MRTVPFRRVTASTPFRVRCLRHSERAPCRARLRICYNLARLFRQVPVQGERWGKLSFPTPEIMMTNFGKWLPSVPETTVERVRLLYGGGEYTRCAPTARAAATCGATGAPQDWVCGITSMPQESVFSGAPCGQT